MRLVFNSLLLTLLFVITTHCVSAEEWRGLTPLKSTRADVVRIFDECKANESYCEFTIENEDVVIVFADVRNCVGVPADTILSIQRELQHETTFAALGLDKRRFKSFDPLPKEFGYRGFIDDQSGLLLKSFRGQIFQINYIPTKKERSSCPDYYRDPREFVQVFLPHVQTVTSVDCPKTKPVAGEKVVIVANYARTGQRITVEWYSTSGRILSGEKTRQILFDTTGLEGKEVTVTVEMNDGSHHTATGSCSFSVSPRPNN